MFDGVNCLEPDHLNQEHSTDVERRRVTIAIASFVGIVVLMGLDLLDDARSGADVGHLLLEGAIMLLAVAGIVVLWQGFLAAERRAGRLNVELADVRQETDRYKDEAREALDGLGEAIAAQFQRWELTPAEGEVGLLLLKGLSHREVADVRGTSEQTVRQQALAVYRKAGLRSRSDLSAFFLEELLLPKAEQNATFAGASRVARGR